MLKEFREFIAKGNVLDMAVGIIIGGIFGKIVSSLVSDVLMPPIGMLLAKVDFKDLGVTLAAAAGGKEAVVISYGKFLNTLLDFIIVSFVIFLLVKAANRMRRKPPEAPAGAPTTRDCPQCLMAVPLKALRCGHCTSELKAI